MSSDKETQRRQNTGLSSLPSAVLHVILRATEHGEDVAALLSALPPLTLPPELVALRDLGAVVDLAHHWPVVRVTEIPIEHAHLGVAALPALQGLYIEPGFAALAWLDATLPPTIPVALVVDPTVSGVLSAFAYKWGDRITHVIIKDHEVHPDPIPDILGRCVTVSHAAIESTKTQVAAAAYLAVLPMHHLSVLEVSAAKAQLDALDVAAIAFWLQGPSATSFSLACTSVSDPTALASAIQASSTLSLLTLDGVLDVQAALVTLPSTLHHITALSLRQSSGLYDVPTHVLLGKLDRTKVVSFALENNNAQAVRLHDVASVFMTCPSLESVQLVNWRLPAVSTTGGACPCLASFTLRQVQFDGVESMSKMMRWLSTSRCLASVDFSYTRLGTKDILELARALPLWMASGLKELQLAATGLGNVDMTVFVVALAAGRNRWRLTIDMSRNDFAIEAVSVLLTTLGACRDVALVFGSTSFVSPTALDLVQEHKLEQPVKGTYTSPPRTSSPWHAH
ncbi:hypothetical protein SPRG_14664 [Saprolegnia parasitica CBS 223.65]|uniref:F-box domain-containing protein n=1 Tax=Saprolegnia parasitica (strain CBS 223.65) TaxID=695850 RepID=A0A067BYS6_SAPPC|nr:hypothetical protein SPRG_14664 [Saprolegnia parasitica CBS 223.65]KDO19481.1 hypothetical protein SPRG_14664 [Saprolegnia parasitica CBS 223.65]|eukprot:XP_012209824.1 hypothetical protein SPRG_14664 [Saprolegnia parasitica CBS 223.65]